MNYEFLCAYCKTSFVPKRTDAKYCSNSCRYKNAHVKRLEKAFLKEKEERKTTILQSIEKLEKENLENTKTLALEKKHEKEKEAFMVTYSKIINLSEVEVFELYLRHQLSKHPVNSISYYEIQGRYAFSSKYEKIQIAQDYLRKLRKAKRQLEEKKPDLFSGPLMSTLFYEENLKSLKKQLAEIELEEFTPPELFISTPSNSSSKVKKKRKRIHPKELGAKDILNINFNTFTLPGELGRFLGELDRNMIAIALTGDSGAGKTYLSFALAKLFITAKMKVKYFSLEEGIGKLTQEKIAFYQLGNSLKMTAEGTLEEIQKDAEYFDVIIVDSYSKLTTKPEEFEELRQDYPNTIFIIIFQKTTSGSIRGGSSIKYNSSATIDVVLRNGRPTSVMKKSRYGTQNWEYDNKSNQIIKET